MTTFSLNVKKFAERAKENADAAIKNVCQELLSDIILNTPVDTGRARFNWFTSVGTPSIQTIEFEGGGAAAQSLAIGRAMPDIAKAAGNVFWITNNLPYISSLEFGLYGEGPKTIQGFSKQAPRGMVRLAINRAERKMR